MKHYLLNFHTYEGFNFNSKLLKFMFYFLWKKNVIRILWVLSDFMLFFFSGREMMTWYHWDRKPCSWSRPGRWVCLCVSCDQFCGCVHNQWWYHIENIKPLIHTSRFLYSLVHFYCSQVWWSFSSPSSGSINSTLLLNQGLLAMMTFYVNMGVISQFVFVNIPWFTLIPCQII